MNHLIKNIIKRFTVSVRASIQPRAQKVFWLAGSLVFLLLSPVAFSAPVINGVIEGSSTAEKAEDARYERTYALWGALLSAADGETALPRLGVQDILAFTTAVHMGKSYEFSEQEIFDILPKGKETSFTIKGRGDAESREQVLHIFEDASLLFYSLQVSYEKESNLGKLRLPEDLEEADLFFAESLKQDILLLRKTSFAKSDRNQWQELAISGIWEANELTRGNVSKDTLRNHALLQSILWVGRELIEKVKKDDEWNGPTESDFDRKSFAKDFRVLRSSLEGENTDASSQGDADEYLNEVELSLYWAIRGILFYESRRVPIYNKNTGVLKSNYPAEILLAQCFNNVYNSYEEVLLPTERFPITFSPGPGEPSVTVDNQTGTRVSRWLEARSIDASPLVKDRIALDFLYANLPGEASNERNLLTILQSVQGGSSVVEVARYWANYYENHPDHRTLVQTPGRVSSSYNSARNALKERSRVYSDEGRSIDLWLKEEKEAALDEIDEAIKEGRRKVYIELTLNFVSLVALPAASEYFSGLEGISMTERDIELVKSMQAAGRAGNARLFLSMFKQLSLETQYLLTTGSEVPFYRTFAFMGAFGAQLANAYIAAPSGYSVWIGRSNLNVEGASIAAKYGTVDLFEYFASIRLALEVLETYHKPKRQGGGLEGAVKVLSDYTQRFNADLSRIHIVFSLLPSEEKTEIESAFSDVDALAIPIHSGNMIETADYILNLEPGTRWSVLEQLQDKYGLLMVVNLLATMVERSAETTAQIFMEYQHSTLLEDSSTSADGKMLQMFLGLGQLYPISNYQQKIIAACDSLELCGDFLLDIGVWTGERGYNDKGVADMLDDLNPLLAGRLLAEMYELEQERTMPDDSFVEDVIIDWLSNDDDIAEQYATAVYIMTTKQVNLNISFRNNTFANNKTKVNEYLADPVGFLLDEDGGENLLLNGGNGGGDDRGDDVLYRTMGQHVMSKGLDYWVAYLAEQLALARDLPIAAKARSAGAISLGTNNTDFMSETVYETGENIDVLAHLILGLLPNADLFPDENWAWLRSWFKYVAPHALGETLDEAYDLNKTEAFESRATKNEEDLDAITAAFLENMKPEDAAALLVAMDPEKAARILALIEDEELLAIIIAMNVSDDPAIQAYYIAFMDYIEEAGNGGELDLRISFAVRLIDAFRHSGDIEGVFDDLYGQNRDHLLQVIVSIFGTNFIDLNELSRIVVTQLSREDIEIILTSLMNQNRTEAVGMLFTAMINQGSAEAAARNIASWLSNELLDPMQIAEAISAMVQNPLNTDDYTDVAMIVQALMVNHDEFELTAQIILNNRLNDNGIFGVSVTDLPDRVFATRLIDALLRNRENFSIVSRLFVTMGSRSENDQILLDVLRILIGDNRFWSSGYVLIEALGHMPALPGGTDILNRLLIRALSSMRERAFIVSDFSTWLRNLVPAGDDVVIESIVNLIEAIAFSNSDATKAFLVKILSKLQPASNERILNAILERGNGKEILERMGLTSRFVRAIYQITDDQLFYRLVNVYGDNLYNYTREIDPEILARIARSNQSFVAGFLLAIAYPNGTYNPLGTKMAAAFLAALRQRLPVVIYELIVNLGLDINAARFQEILAVPTRNNPRRSVLSYHASSDHDGDDYWEPRNNDGDLITNTDHHFSFEQGVRHLRTSSLNYTYHFDGTGGLSMESLQDLQGDPTEGSAAFELWLRPSSLPKGDDERVLFESGDKTEGVALILGQRSVTLSLSKIGGYLEYNATSSKTLSVDEYSHVVGVIDQTANSLGQYHLRLYINGEPAGSASYPSNQSIPDNLPIESFLQANPSWTYDARDWSDDGGSGLGSLSSAAYQASLYDNLKNFEGWMSEFHFYDRALSAAEVSSLYQSYLTAPETLTVSKKSMGGLKIPELSWSEVSAASSYNIYRTESNVALPLPADLIARIDGGASTTYLDEDVDPETNYRYWITSHDYWQESNYSEVAIYNSKSGGGRLNSGGGRLNSSNSSSNGSSSNGDDRGFNRKALSHQSTAAAPSVSNILKPAVLMLEDYDGGGLSGYEFNPQGDSTIYLVEDGAGGTAIECVVDTAGPTIHYVKLLDVAEDISNYNSLLFDFRSLFYDASSTIEIQLRFTNKQNPDVENYWNWFSPVPLSSGHGEWTRVIVDLSEINFQLGVEMRPGCDFNLDSLEGIAVLINSSGQTYNIVELDNIQLSSDKSY